MPEDFNNSVLEYASEQFGTKPEETTAATEMAVATETTETETTTNQAAEMATEATSTEATETQNTQATETTVVEPDYNKWLETESGGVLKDVDTFKSILPKLSEYDQLVAQKAELEQKLNVKPFQNEFVEKLNDFYKSGAREDQIKNFIKVSSVDIDKLSPVDVKVAVMVKEGYTEEMAKLIVEQDFPIDSFEEGSTDRLILEEKLRVSSQKDLETLKQYKADISKIDNPLEAIQAQQEQARLEGIAKAEQFKNQVTQVVPKIAEAITGIGELVIKPGKEGESEAMKMAFDYSDDFKAQIPEKLSNYFLETNTPLTPEAVIQAEDYIKANYLAQNIESILQANTRHVEAITWEKAVNKYENRSGLPQETVNTNVDNSQAEYSSFLNKVATGK